MTPLEFARKYEYDRRLVTGEYFSADALPVEEGETIGVVLLNLGGPDKTEDVAPFLYNLFMDPAIIDMPVGARLRHWLCKLISSMRSRSVAEDYEMIGGGSPINRLTEEQAESLEKVLNRRYGREAGVTFRTYIAMRYWHPFSEEAAAEMEHDGVDKVVLLPLYPQYSKTTTGSSLLYWWQLEEDGEIPAWPTTHVFEYAANPKYVQAVSERIDQALQRFSSSVRDEVQIVFSAHGTPLREMTERRDPYCCLIHSTVDRVMACREHDLDYHVAFQSKVGPAEWLTPSTPDKLEELAHRGDHAVLIVPIAFVTEHIETSYELDIEIREEAEAAGIDQYEVMPALNCHPLFIEALAEATVSQVALPGGEPFTGGDEESGTYPLVPERERPRYSSKERCSRCHQCELITEARRWTAAGGDGAPSPEPFARSRAADN